MFRPFLLPAPRKRWLEPFATSRSTASALLLRPPRALCLRASEPDGHCAGQVLIFSSDGHLATAIPRLSVYTCNSQPSSCLRPRAQPFRHPIICVCRWMVPLVLQRIVSAPSRLPASGFSSDADMPFILPLDGRTDMHAHCPTFVYNSPSRHPQACPHTLGMHARNLVPPSLDFMKPQASVPSPDSDREAPQGPATRAATPTPPMPSGRSIVRSWNLAPHSPAQPHSHSYLPGTSASGLKSARPRARRLRTYIAHRPRTLRTVAPASCDRARADVRVTIKSLPSTVSPALSPFPFPPAARTPERPLISRR
ncbi:hypothetical protein C8Q79DRAFT_212210 [Trametes meyenii]|nr:hypothetical protein C8Q79DRAFT_212210 [Trametes meyenii]